MTLTPEDNDFNEFCIHVSYLSKLNDEKEACQSIHYLENAMPRFGDRCFFHRLSAEVYMNVTRFFEKDSEMCSQLMLSSLNSARRSVELSPDAVEYYLCLGTFLDALGKFEEAVEICDKGLSIKNPTNPGSELFQNRPGCDRINASKEGLKRLRKKASMAVKEVRCRHAMQRLDINKEALDVKGEVENAVFSHVVTDAVEYLANEGRENSGRRLVNFSPSLTVEEAAVLRTFGWPLEMQQIGESLSLRHDVPNMHNLKEKIHVCKVLITDYYHYKERVKKVDSEPQLNTGDTVFQRHIVDVAKLMTVDAVQRLICAWSDLKASLALAQAYGPQPVHREAAEVIAEVGKVLQTVIPAKLQSK